MFSFSVDLGWRSQYVGIEKLVLDGVTIYLVDNQYYFGDRVLPRRRPRGRAVRLLHPRRARTPSPTSASSRTSYHCNDWHTAMIPVLLRTQYGNYVHGRMKTLLTIHNIAYQGKFGFEFFRDLLRIEDKYLTPEFIELNGCGAFLKGGCVFADRLSTVSPSYADEICTPYYGEGLEGILSARRHQLSGIINGIDTKTFNPFSDPLIPKKFDKGHLKGKQVCKESLMFDMGLHADPRTPLIAMVTRMTPQKGFDLIARVLDEMMYFDICFLLLGSGARKYETFMREAENRHRGRVCSYIGYNEELAHRIYAGADMLLMPSRFEPCGLSQMIAMRYGTLPIVRRDRRPQGRRLNALQPVHRRGQRPLLRQLQRPRDEGHRRDAPSTSTATSPRPGPGLHAQRHERGLQLCPHGAEDYAAPLHRHAVRQAYGGQRERPLYAFGGDRPRALDAKTRP